MRINTWKTIILEKAQVLPLATNSLPLMSSTVHRSPGTQQLTPLPTPALPTRDARRTLQLWLLPSAATQLGSLPFPMPLADVLRDVSWSAQTTPSPKSLPRTPQLQQTSPFPLLCRTALALVPEGTAQNVCSYLSSRLRGELCFSRCVPSIRPGTGWLSSSLLTDQMEDGGCEMMNSKGK